MSFNEINGTLLRDTMPVSSENETDKLEHEIKGDDRRRPLLEVRDLSQSFISKKDGAKQVVQAVDHVSFKVYPGEIVCLLGRNGAGKSTTFKMTSGETIPPSGEVFLDGKDVTNFPLYKRAQMGMGYLPQKNCVFQSLSVEDNLLGIMEMLGLSRKIREERCEELLEQFNLTERRGHLASRLSGGEVRSLEIARALITKPKIILLDEPFANVDAVATRLYSTIFQTLRDKHGMSIFLVDHNVPITLDIGDRIYLLDNGKIIFSGTPTEIRENPRASRFIAGLPTDDNQVH